VATNGQTHGQQREGKAHRRKKPVALNLLCSGFMSCYARQDLQNLLLQNFLCSSFVSYYAQQDLLLIFSSNKDDVAQADKSEEKLCSQVQSSTRKLKRKIKLSFNDNQ
jgi:hypothetical protein